MAKFAFLLPHAPDRYTDLDQEAYTAIISDYVAWVEYLAAKGVYQGGHKLGTEGSVTLTGGEGKAPIIHDRPFAELAEIVGGIMIVEVEDMSAAIELAKVHPHLVHNSKIEIRPVEG